MIYELFKEFDGAYAENSIRAYRADFKHYSDWCARNRYRPLEATSEIIANYVIEMSQTLKSTTIRRRLASLSVIFDMTRTPNATNGKEVLLAVKRMHRSIGRAQEQATPLTYDHLEALLEACPNTMRGKRDALLLQIGYETMRRRSEIVSFKFEDLRTLDGERYALLLGKSKKDQFRQGKLIPISKKLAEQIQSWSETIDESEGYILRRFYRGGNIGESMEASSINTVLRGLQKRANLGNIPDFSGYSFRVGAALDLLKRGVPLEKIMLRGGWKSEMTALRYLRSWVGEEVEWLV